MPVSVKRIKGKHRIVEAASGKVSLTSQGNPKDGGGHESRAKAVAQARAINMALKGIKLKGKRK